MKNLVILIAGILLGAPFVSYAIFSPSIFFPPHHSDIIIQHMPMQPAYPSTIVVGTASGSTTAKVYGAGGGGGSWGTGGYITSGIIATGCAQSGLEKLPGTKKYVMTYECD